MGSGTAALTLSFRAYDIGPGDEVITAPNSFFASAEAISLVGATPVFVDVDENTANMNTALVEDAITEHTKAIIPVHLYGQPAAMGPILEIVKKHELKVIEDAAQAHGANYKGERIGSIGNAAAFSFYPGKNLGAYGEAGAVTTNDEAIAEKIDWLRRHGEPERYVHRVVGYNERMDGIQGAVLNVKLKYLDSWTEKRREHAKTYTERLEGTGDIKHFQVSEDRDHVYHLFVIRTEKRDALQEFLKEKGIQTGIHYPIPIHLQEAYKDARYKEDDFPVAEQLSKEILSLPMSEQLTEEQCNYVCAQVTAFFS